MQFPRNIVSFAILCDTLFRLNVILCLRLCASTDRGSALQYWYYVWVLPRASPSSKASGDC